MTTVSSNPLPVYKQIKAQLVRRIGRAWSPGQQLPSIRELSSELGAGYVNTHRAVRELTDEGLLNSRDRVGVFVPDKLDTEQLERLSSNHDATSQTVKRPLAGLRIGLVARDFEPDLYLRRIIETFESAMAEHGCRISRVQVEDFKDLCLPNSEAEAIAVIHPNGIPIELNEGQVAVIVKPGDVERLQVTPPQRYDLVSVADHQGAVLAGQYMRAADVEDVCFIGRRKRNTKYPTWDPTSANRLAGFEQGYGAAIAENRQLEVNWYGASEGARAVPQFIEMSPRPTGVFAATDDLALGFIHGAQAHGLEPGRDYQIVGFDGQQAGRDLPEGPLTTIDVPSKEMGLKAAELLSERLLNPDQPIRHLLLGGKLFEGKTVQPNRATR